MPKEVVDDFILIPRELIEKNLELILCGEIMFINQQELFKKIDKEIRVQGLVPLGNRIKSAAGHLMWQ